MSVSYTGKLVDAGRAPGRGYGVCRRRIAEAAKERWMSAHNTANANSLTSTLQYDSDGVFERANITAGVYNAVFRMYYIGIKPGERLFSNQKLTVLSNNGVGGNSSFSEFINKTNFDNPDPDLFAISRLSYSEVAASIPMTIPSEYSKIGDEGGVEVEVLRASIGACRYVLRFTSKFKEYEGYTTYTNNYWYNGSWDTTATDARAQMSHNAASRDTFLSNSQETESSSSTKYTYEVDAKRLYNFELSSYFSVLDGHYPTFLKMTVIPEELAIDFRDEDNLSAGSMNFNIGWSFKVDGSEIASGTETNKTQFLKADYLALFNNGSNYTGSAAVTYRVDSIRVVDMNGALTSLATFS